MLRQDSMPFSPLVPQYLLLVLALPAFWLPVQLLF